MAKLGVAVTVVESALRILPQYDEELTNPIMARLKELGITVHLTAKAKGMSEDGTTVVVEAKYGERNIPSDKVLVTIGRAPVVDGFGLDDLGLTIEGAACCYR